MTITSARAAARRGCLALALVLGACVPAVPRSPTLVPAPRTTNQWLVEPGDQVRLRVWNENNDASLTEVMVNDAGEVLIPNVGHIKVAGVSSADVERTVIASYKGRLDPSRIDVVFLRPVSVLGGVKSPGVQLSEPTATVLSLIVRSGGPISPSGGDLHAYLLRVGQPVREVSTADRVADLGIRAADQLYLQDPPFGIRNEVAIRTFFEILSVVTTTITLVFALSR